MLIRHTPTFPLPIGTLMVRVVLAPLVAGLVLRIGFAPAFDPAALATVRATPVTPAARNEP